MLTPKELKEARVREGISAADLAFLVGVTERNIHRWEAGDRPITAMAEKVLRATLNLNGHSRKTAARR